MNLDDNIYFSKHNIFSKIKDSNEYFIINSLTNSADILDEESAEYIKKGEYDKIEGFADAGYLISKSEENKLYKQKYLDFLDGRDNDDVQIFFVPWYTCNFNCSYCFQDEYTNPKEMMSLEMVDVFFEYIKTTFAGKTTYVTIFGGEPLMNGKKPKELIKYVVDKAIEYDIDISVVTNGFYLEEYVDILKKAKVREIQVTVDGLAEIHNVRRPLKGSDDDTFSKIVKGIDATLKAGISINLRMVVDRENVDDLPKLAKFAIDKGWTKNSLFKTQLGRNYELHHCQLDNERLFSRVSMYSYIYEQLKKYPYILEFHKPAYSISKFLFENGDLPEPLFDSCPGAKTEWAFDYTGKIYSCTATVGKVGEELGTFYPEISLKEDLIEQWEDRDVTTIPKCKDCNLQLACGGGCASISFNETGKIISPNCRPITELLEMGVSVYFNENSGIKKENIDKIEVGNLEMN